VLISAGATQSQTINFSNAADFVSFDGTFGAGSIVGGGGADTLQFLSTSNVSGTGISFGSSAVQANFLGSNTLVFGSNIAAASQISFGSGNDLATFSGALGAASIFGGAGDDTLRFTSSLSGTSLQGGVGVDQFLGSVTIGSGGVSFWGGVGADTFNFTQITGGGAGATAYFWNTEAGQDVIIFGNQISGSSGSPGVVFGITSGAASGFNISFAGGQSTNSFNGGAFSNQFLFSGSSTLVTAGFATDKLTIQFVGGSLITLSGGGFNAIGSTGIFSNFGAGTANFGASNPIPTFS